MLELDGLDEELKRLLPAELDWQGKRYQLLATTGPIDYMSCGHLIIVYREIKVERRVE